MPVRDVEEGGRAGPAVEVLVAAADGEVDVPRVELDGHDADRVAEVPQDQRARVVGDLRQRRGVGEPGGPVGHVAQHHQRGLRSHRFGELVGGDAGGGVDVDPPEGHAELVGDPLGDVAVGREVVTVDRDLRAAGPCRDCGPDQLVDQHGGRVADGGLPGSGTEGDPAEPVTEGERQVEPALVPAADQSVAPVVPDELRESLGGPVDRPAEGVPVEVDQPPRGPEEP